MPHQTGHREGLQRHFMGTEVTPGHQRVLVGTKPLVEGWVMSIIKIDGCTNEAEAVWLGQCIQSDLIEYISIANDESRRLRRSGSSPVRLPPAPVGLQPST